MSSYSEASMQKHISLPTVQIPPWKKFWPLLQTLIRSALAQIETLYRFSLTMSTPYSDKAVEGYQSNVIGIVINN